MWIYGNLWNKIKDTVAFFLCVEIHGNIDLKSVGDYILWNVVICANNRKNEKSCIFIGINTLNCGMYIISTIL